MSRHNAAATEGEMDRIAAIGMVCKRCHGDGFLECMCHIGPVVDFSGGLTVDGPGFEEYRAIHGGADDAEAKRLIDEARAACFAPVPRLHPDDIALIAARVVLLLDVGAIVREVSTRTATLLGVVLNEPKVTP